MPVRPFGKVLDARKQKPTLPANPDYSAPPLTVECLAKLDSRRDFNILVASEPKTSGTHWELYTYAGSGVLSVYMPGYIPAEIRSNAVVADGEWHYCAMTFDGRLVRIFVDGNLVRTERLRRQSGLAPVPGPLCVGHIAGTGLGCEGFLDEVRVSSVLRDVQAVPSAPFEDDRDTLALWHFDPPLASTGASCESDPFKAGAEASLQARKALAGAKARAVVVFDALEGGAAERERLIEGIGWFFETSLVYGCNGFGALTRQTNAATVGVLAFGEEVEVSSFCEPVGSSHSDCGRRLGEKLRGSRHMQEGRGRLVVVFGDCHYPANDALAQGLIAGYGSALPLVGGSCPQGGFVYEAGRIRRAANVALGLAGDFAVTIAQGQAMSADDVVASAERTARAAAGNETSNIALSLLFDCVSRKQALGAHVKAEIQAIGGALPVGPLCGFYGSGEVRSDSVSRPASGLTGHLVIACLHTV